MARVAADRIVSVDDCGAGAACPFPHNIWHKRSAPKRCKVTGRMLQILSEKPVMRRMVDAMSETCVLMRESPLPVQAVNVSSLHGAVPLFLILQFSRNCSPCHHSTQRVRRTAMRCRRSAHGACSHPAGGVNRVGRYDCLRAAHGVRVLFPRFQCSSNLRRLPTGRNRFFG